ncbi:molybdopterin-guanine dinucleotide biosynthesis protein B, partial [Acidiplasma aeolicum]
MAIFSFFGSSKSGKTTVIYDLIKRLHKDFKIMYIKDIPHDNISLDTENKDTWKMENAGAYITYGLTPSKSYKMINSHLNIDDIIAENNADIIFIEGFKSYKKAIKFLVLGNEDFLKYEHNY